jgi:hypothetical protein
VAASALIRSLQNPVAAEYVIVEVILVALLLVWCCTLASCLASFLAMCLVLRRLVFFRSLLASTSTVVSIKTSRKTATSRFICDYAGASSNGTPTGVLKPDMLCNQTVMRYMHSVQSKEKKSACPALWTGFPPSHRVLEKMYFCKAVRGCEMTWHHFESQFSFEKLPTM